MTAASRTADEIIADWHAGRADHDPYDEIGGLVAEVVRLRSFPAVEMFERAQVELARTEGDLGVAIREAARCREAVKAVEPWFDLTTEAPDPSADQVRRLIAAALDQRLAPDETEESPDDPAVMLSLIDDQADQIESLQGRIEGQAATISALRVVAARAGSVMETLQEHGPGIVGHLLDDDDNAGQRLREALRAVSL